MEERAEEADVPRISATRASYEVGDISRRSGAPACSAVAWLSSEVAAVVDAVKSSMVAATAAMLALAQNSMGLQPKGLHLKGLVASIAACMTERSPDC